MPTWIRIIYRIIITIAIQVQAVGGFGVQVGGIIGADKSAPFGGVVAGVAVIQAGVIVVVVAPVADGVGIGVTLLRHIYFTIFHAHSQEKGWPAKQASPS